MVNQIGPNNPDKFHGLEVVEGRRLTAEEKKLFVDITAAAGVIRTLHIAGKLSFNESKLMGNTLYLATEKGQKFLVIEEDGKIGYTDTAGILPEDYTIRMDVAEKLLETLQGWIAEATAE